MGFWDTFKKTAAVGTAAGAAIGVTTMGISSLLGSKHKRKMTEKQMEIEERKQNQKERKDMLDQEIKLKELELKQKQMESSAYVDLAKTQMNTHADLQKTQMSTQANVQGAAIKGYADVKKAEAMYGSNGINNSGMFYDRENGIMVDNRNISVNTSMGMGLMGINYSQVAHTNNMNTNQVQQKLLEAHNLLKQGLISQEDFNQIKSELLKEAF